MDELLELKKVSNDEYQQMFLIIQDLMDYIYGDIDDISEKGADSMIQEKFTFTYDKAIAEGENINSLKTAEKMLKANESVGKIEEYTDLRFSEIKLLAEKIGVSLVL